MMNTLLLSFILIFLSTCIRCFPYCPVYMYGILKEYTLLVGHVKNETLDAALSCSYLYI